MADRRIDYVEKVTDAHGVERVYGYSLDGRKYLLNLMEVVEKYEKKGIDTLKMVV